MPTCTAFQTSADDIELALRRHSLSVSDTQGQSFAQMAETLLMEIDCDRVEQAALAAGCCLETQTQAALTEIRLILTEQGVLA